MNARFLVSTWVLALTACGGQAEIGSDACSRSGVGCELQPPRSEGFSTIEPVATISVAPESLYTLEHAGSLEPLGGAELAQYSYMADREGTLWEFGVQLAFPDILTGGQGEARLRVRTTSLAGDVQEHSVEAPWKPSPENRMDMVYSRSTVQGPIVDVTWYKPKCENGDCALDETLTFSWDPAQAPERKHWSSEIVWAAQVKDHWTFVTGSATGPTIEQRTRAGDVVWRQTALKDSGYEQYSGIDLLETGELAILAVIPHVAEVPDLWRIGFDGKVKQRLTLQGLQQGARLLHDSQHRALAMGVAGDGGILVLRHDSGETLRSWHFERTEYSELSVFAQSIDTADTLYVLTESGGQKPKDRVPVLCHVRSNDAAGCFVLERPEGAKTLDRMQATGPGVVYVGDGHWLFRYELPSD